MFLYSGFDMFIVSVLTAGGGGLLIVNALYAPMTFTAVLGIILFTMFLTEKKEEASHELEKTSRKPKMTFQLIMILLMCTQKE